MMPEVMKKLKVRDIVAVCPGGVLAEGEGDEEAAEMLGGEDRHLEDHWLGWVVERCRSIKASDDKEVHGTTLQEDDDCRVIQWMEHGSWICDHEGNEKVRVFKKEDIPLHTLATEMMNLISWMKILR